jgi:hypothetical protein
MQTTGCRVRIAGNIAAAKRREIGMGKSAFIMTANDPMSAYMSHSESQALFNGFSNVDTAVEVACNDIDLSQI